jgi:hypothetical protein
MSKKVCIKICAVVVLMVLAAAVFAQDPQNVIGNLVNKLTSFLGKPVPSGFTRIERETYENEDMGTALFTENNIVAMSAFVTSFPTFDEAVEVNGRYYIFFERNWSYIRTAENRSDIYSKNGVYARISGIPRKMDDGLFSIGILFSRNINRLFRL